MKKILIIGEHSYIGNSFREYISQWTQEYTVDVVSSRNGAWKDISFAEYDSILHVAGIAHVDAKANMESLYYQVNRDLTIACCRKAKEDGAGQFIFLSSIIVYGESKTLAPVVITEETIPNPNGFYGRSKLEAEQGILPFGDDTFKVVAVRPPMVYGNGSKGNYRKLAKLAKTIPFFPNMKNQRSMIYIEHLCACIKKIIDEQRNGIICPQNQDYVETVDLVQTIGKCHGKNVHGVSLFNPFIRLFAKKIGFINKVFGTLIYDKDWTDSQMTGYCDYDFAETIRRTEGEKI